MVDSRENCGKIALFPNAKRTASSIGRASDS
jgi:hypothetical protein